VSVGILLGFHNCGENYTHWGVFHHITIVLPADLGWYFGQSKMTLQAYIGEESDGPLRNKMKRSPFV
jgi:hypothetical protein